MCAIIDANVRDQIFGDKQPQAGEFLFNWLNNDKRTVKLVVGGKLLRELSDSKAFNTWLQTALLFGRAQRIPDDKVEIATKELQDQQICRSDDEHVLALAKLSGARLLFTNDKPLQKTLAIGRYLKGFKVEFTPQSSIDTLQVRTRHFSDVPTFVAHSAKR